jgi:hypothetical protein
MTHLTVTIVFDEIKQLEAQNKAFSPKNQPQKDCESLVT